MPLQNKPFGDHHDIYPILIASQTLSTETILARFNRVWFFFVYLIFYLIQLPFLCRQTQIWFQNAISRNCIMSNGIQRKMGTTHSRIPRNCRTYPVRTHFVSHLMITEVNGFNEEVTQIAIIIFFYLYREKKINSNFFFLLF